MSELGLVADHLREMGKVNEGWVSVLTSLIWLRIETKRDKCSTAYR